MLNIICPEASVNPDETGLRGNQAEQHLAILKGSASKKVDQIIDLLGISLSADVA
jgi:hypothetical protein